MATTLSTFELFQLNSERFRAIAIVMVLVVMALLGLYRWIDPIPQQEMVGPIILAFCVTILLFVLYYLQQVQKAIRDGSGLSLTLVYIEIAIESLAPAVVTIAIIAFTPIDPLYALVSPGYSVMYIVLAASLLRMRVSLTLLTGLILFTSYVSIVIWALYIDTPSALPYGEMFYINHVVSLAVAVVLSVFLTRELNKYVHAAVREVQVSQENDRMLHEMSIAGEIQNQLLPSPLPAIPGYSLAALCEPAEHTGGDYYDCILLPDGKVAISIADVTGHGIGPAIIASSCRACIRSMLHEKESQELDIIKVLEHVNSLLHQDVTSGRFITLALMILDSNTHEMTYLSAGHAPSLLYQAASSEVQMVSSQGHPIGVTDTLELEQPLNFRFEPGDMFVMFSDGIYESSNEKREPFGLKRLCDHLMDHSHIEANELVTSLHTAACTHGKHTGQADDMTAIVVQRKR